MLVGVFEAGCATARPGPVTAAATASANSFLFIENVSSSFDFKAAKPRRPLNPEQGLLQFCQSKLSSSMTTVIFSTPSRWRVAFPQHLCNIKYKSISYE